MASTTVSVSAWLEWNPHQSPFSSSVPSSHYLLHGWFLSRSEWKRSRFGNWNLLWPRPSTQYEQETRWYLSIFYPLIYPTNNNFVIRESLRIIIIWCPPTSSNQADPTVEVAFRLGGNLWEDTRVMNSGVISLSPFSGPRHESGVAEIIAVQIALTKIHQWSGFK